MRGLFQLFYFCSYVAFRLCEALLRLLPLSLVFSLGKRVGVIGYVVLPRRRNVALTNLRLAFGAQMSEAQLREINREHFQLLCANLFAGLKAATMSNNEVWEHVTANIPENRTGRSWIALISHIGNWELFSHLGEKFPEFRFGAVYQSLANPYIDGYLRRTRALSGITLFDRRQEILKCVQFLKEGGVVGVLIDQAAGYAGIWTPLFGRLTSSSTLAATLAIRTRAPVVPLAIYTRGKARWELIVSDPLDPADDDPEALTAKINRVLEHQIRRAPADWLWAHNRWKPLRPHVLFARDQRRVYFPPDSDRVALDPFRILIVSPATSEEAAATIRAVEAIKMGRPDTSLTVLTPATISEFWGDNPNVHRSIDWSGNDSAQSVAAKIRQAAQFDVAVFFASSWKTALAVRLAGIPIRVGRRSSAASWLFNQHPAEPTENLDPADAHLLVASSIGANIYTT